MKNMYFLNDKIANNYLKNNGIKICHGIYRIDDTIIKRFNPDKSRMIYDEFDEKKLLQFKDVDVEQFYFIKSLLFTGAFNIHSTIYKYASGIDIDQKSLASYNIDDIINAIGVLQNSIKKLSELGIYANDVNYGNVIFDGMTLSIIDTCEYYYSENDPSQVYEDNLMYIMNTIFSNLFYTFYQNRFSTVRMIHKYFSIRGSEFENFRQMDYLMDPVNTLIGMRKFMEEDLGVSLYSFGESFDLIDKAISNDFYSKVRTLNK